MPGFDVVEDRPQYAAVPFPLIEAMIRREIGFASVALYAALDRYRNRKTKACWVGLRTLAQEVGLGITTVHRLLHALASAGYLRIEEADAQHGGRHTYYLLYAPGRAPVRAGGGVPPAEHPVPPAFQNGGVSGGEAFHLTAGESIQDRDIRTEPDLKRTRGTSGGALTLCQKCGKILTVGWGPYAGQMLCQGSPCRMATVET